ncbi:MAG: hypothetical protein B7X10_01255 [Burkholderiales bacterium 21-58-4]|nr:MAG: hypothetical protein B7X10_01255 [Burkholderiales bacterium 21-58-4]
MRKSTTFTVNDDGRDNGKVFKITEMSADGAERWALRAFFALMNAGVDIPEDIASMGLAGVAQIGLKALTRIPFEAAEPLLQDMMDCVQLIPDPSKPNVLRALIDGDIEEVMTRLQLRKAVFDIHVEFLKLGAPSTSAQEGATPA